MSSSSAGGDQPVKLWGGRFTGATDPIMEAFNRSMGYDQRMWRQDIQGSQAYAAALCKAGIISQEEATAIRDGLAAVQSEWEQGTFEEKQSDEDIHSANERRLTELIGSVAGKLHTGRSRNDQVATDIRLWLRDEIQVLRAHLLQLIETATNRAEAEVDILMPGYTHLQPAQPVRWSHWVMAHASSWQRDVQRLDDLLTRVELLPLGSGALAGNPFGVDRLQIAKELGLKGVTPNSMDAVSDRDFVAEFMFWASMTMVHLSRWSEDLIIYCSGEFGFVKMADAYSTGSSLMPQKKNPDALELLRGKSGRVMGHLSGFMTTMKGLPSTYNKDMQEDKEPLFDTVDTMHGAIPVAVGVCATMEVVPARMQARLASEMLATDLAEYLVRKGVPFRQTHHIAGDAVRMAEERGVELASLTYNDLKGLHEAFGEDVIEVWDFTRSVEQRDVIGGTSRRAVLEQVEKMRSWMRSLN